MTLVISATSTILLMEGREADAYRLAGAERRLISETGLHLASRIPGTGIPSIDPDTTDPVLRQALAEGAAWTREEAVERALELEEAVARGPAPS